MIQNSIGKKVGNRTYFVGISDYKSSIRIVSFAKLFFSYDCEKRRLNRCGGLWNYHTCNAPVDQELTGQGLRDSLRYAGWLMAA
ncbi:hypothetical protein SAMN05660909_04132 [Chitinophaga terrae (ex Kim and Jung 2007)]|uniref:Uncharacterized protein n=1 Tax=Chitinophaga terrae (ex Kim and Jung 2007) TaxID=408074 RepID=A0A1H4F3F6_9BACT|nr:hypothetical protein CTE07_36800 [Chitinophaga terrae (ex Kim and Jung 2007)]SEA91769.1 hypothetical protein SAMN05660909_04132 [Chitinophaga terrae (ex Kim and Jung 2007)]